MHQEVHVITIHNMRIDKSNVIVTCTIKSTYNILQSQITYTGTLKYLQYEMTVCYTIFPCISFFQNLHSYTVTVP